MHHIKKYANRKLYDTTDKRYISLARLSELLKNGEDVVIIDNVTGKDLTASIVSSLIAHTTKTKQNDEETISSGMLIRLFRKGSATLTDYTKKYTSLWQKSFTMAEDELDHLVKKLVKNREISKAEGLRMKADIAGFTRAMKSWMTRTIDKKVSEMMTAMNLATREHVSRLEERIDKLEKKVAAFEKLHQEDRQPISRNKK